MEGQQEIKPKTVRRLDAIDPARWMTTPFTRSPEGFMTGRAIVTSVGVFTYLNKDGSRSRELRLPEEVFSSDSLATMKLKPVVNSHPAEKVTDENVKKYQVGSLGSNPSSTVQKHDWDGGYTDWEKLTDGFHVAIDMIINDKDTINDVLNGKRALSMGYECETEMAEPGSVWCGMAYDCIQRNIRYNHCAIEDAARAGDAARIRMDSADFGPDDAVLINHTDASGDSPRSNSTEDKMGMKKINLDGVDYEGEEKLIQFFQDQKKRADAAEKDLEKARADSTEAKAAISKIEADRDIQKDRADKAENALKEAKEQTLDPKRLDEAVNARIVLFDAAERAGVETKDGMSDLEIKKAVISAVSPSAKLDGKDDVYIVARFDAAVEELDNRTDAEGRAVLGGGVPPASGRNDSATARRRMIENLKAQSRGEKTEGK